MFDIGKRKEKEREGERERKKEKEGKSSLLDFLWNSKSVLDLVCNAKREERETLVYDVY